MIENWKKLKRINCKEFEKNKNRKNVKNEKEMKVKKFRRFLKEENEIKEN